jgi:CBS-domain-containing membrane protein
MSSTKRARWEPGSGLRPVPVPPEAWHNGLMTESSDSNNPTRASLEPLTQSTFRQRRRLRLRDEFLLALLPTAMILFVLFLVETFSRQRLLFASLASSAFLIYLDPQHGANTIRSLVISHLLAAIVGAVVCGWLGEGYLAAGTAMVITIVTIIALDVVHPPAVSTALGFAFRSENTSGW